MSRLCAPITAVLLAAAITTEASAASIEFGKYLSGECTSCHRIDGEVKGIPSIVGWPADQFVAVLQSYKMKDRPNVVMQSVASRLSDEEMSALAAYYATIPARQ